MQKQLNSELFGTASGVSAATSAKTVATNAVMGPKTQVLEQKLMETRVQVGQLAEQLAHVVSQVNEFIRMSQLKFEKLQQGLKNLEANQSEAVLETAQKLGIMHSRLSESKNMEVKIQTMVDRHQQVLRSYELRTAQLQKLLSEREADLIEAQAALNESKMELMRLKRL